VVEDSERGRRLVNGMREACVALETSGVLGGGVKADALELDGRVGVVLRGMLALLGLKGMEVAAAAREVRSARETVRGLKEAVQAMKREAATLLLESVAATEREDELARENKELRREREVAEWKSLNAVGLGDESCGGRGKVKGEIVPLVEEGEAQFARNRERETVQVSKLEALKMDSGRSGGAEAKKGGQPEPGAVGKGAGHQEGVAQVSLKLTWSRGKNGKTPVGFSVESQGDGQASSGGSEEKRLHAHAPEESGELGGREMIEKLERQERRLVQSRAREKALREGVEEGEREVRRLREEAKGLREEMYEVLR